MIEEPYRWVEAIANRREYIETQLGSGSAIVALGCREGILFVTVGQTRQKIFEIYDRIAMGAIGHPGDIERLRMAAIELASAEGFARSAADVSLRRLAHYSLSPVLKTAFEQVYGAPYLARLLFAEVGATPEADLFLRIDYDGAIATNGGNVKAARQDFAVLAGMRQSTDAMESYLQREHQPSATMERSLKAALNALARGKADLADAGGKAGSSPDQIASEREAQNETGIEAALLERSAATAIRYRLLTPEELKQTARD
ncbi:MAG: 20S proteasome subunit A/B [Chthoniobacterales bacterium]|nr:20S proteasome subunit A/B [Chthoniobacterales bacterium]